MFAGLYTGMSGIRAAQIGIDVASHNVANAATPGYTRQRVELAASPAYQSASGPIGTGVTVESIGRLRDAFTDTRLRSAIGDHAQSSVRADLLGQIEALSGEPDQGISARMTKLWDAAESWSNAPADPAARRQVLSELSSVTETIRSTAASWDTLETDVTSRRDTGVTIVNDTLAALQELDIRLAGIPAGKVGADLLDQRDMLLDDLAQMTGATVGLDTQGRATVTLDGQDLLAAGQRRELAVVDGAIHVVDVGTPAGTPGDAVSARGELGGLQRVLNEDLPRWRGELDAYAEALAAAINTVNQGGATADGTPGAALLGFDADDPAGSIAVLTTATADLAAGQLPATPGDAVAPNDGRNARTFADLRTTKLGADGTSQPDGITLENRLSDLIVGLAGDVRSSRSGAESARAVAVGANQARMSQHGVSIDEEMVALVRYQRSLEAASRVMTTVDQALDVLINRTGIVGR